MTGLIHPSTPVEAGPPEPDIDGGYVVEETSRFVPPSPPHLCDGPGPLAREYIDVTVTTHQSVRVEWVEPCPTCDNTMQHAQLRHIALEDQDEAGRHRPPGEPARKAS